MTLLEMYNLCLSRLGSRQVLTSTTGTGPTDVAIALAYPVARDALLSEHPWPFATTHQELQEIAMTVPGWTYAYAHPEGALAITRLYSDNTPEGQSEDYLVLSNEDGTDLVVATNIVPAYARYTLQITDPGRFSSGFADALSYRVAADLALPIANDMNLREHLYKLYIQVLDQAKVVASRNKTHRIPISGRYRGARQ